MLPRHRFRLLRTLKTGLEMEVALAHSPALASMAVLDPQGARSLVEPWTTAAAVAGRRMGDEATSGGVAGIEWSAMAAGTALRNATAAVIGSGSASVTEAETVIPTAVSVTVAIVTGISRCRGAVAVAAGATIEDGVTISAAVAVAAVAAAAAAVGSPDEAAIVTISAEAAPAVEAAGVGGAAVEAEVVALAAIGSAVATATCRGHDRSTLGVTILADMGVPGRAVARAGHGRSDVWRAYPRDKDGLIGRWRRRASRLVRPYGRSRRCARAFAPGPSWASAPWIVG